MNENMNTDIISKGEDCEEVFVADVANMTFQVPALDSQLKPIPQKDGQNNPVFRKGQPVHQVIPKKFDMLSTAKGSTPGQSVYYLVVADKHPDGKAGYTADKLALENLVKTGAGVYTLTGFEKKYNAKEQAYRETISGLKGKLTAEKASNEKTLADAMAEIAALKKASKKG